MLGNPQAIAYLQVWVQFRKYIKMVFGNLRWKELCLVYF